MCLLIWYPSEGLRWFTRKWPPKDRRFRSWKLSFWFILSFHVKRQECTGQENMGSFFESERKSGEKEGDHWWWWFSLICLSVIIVLDIFLWLKWYIGYEMSRLTYTSNENKGQYVLVLFVGWKNGTSMCVLGWVETFGFVWVIFFVDLLVPNAFGIGRS